MLRNYLTVAIRNLIRHKTYSVINTLGLSVGMACGILILLFIQDEFKHASYHPNGHRIFKVWREIKHPAGKSVFKEWHEGKIALAMRDQFPEIQVVARANASHFTEQWIRVAHKMRREFFVVAARLCLSNSTWYLAVSVRRGSLACNCADDSEFSNRKGRNFQSSRCSTV